MKFVASFFLETFTVIKVHITPLTKFLWGQNVTCKIFPESGLWFSHNLDFGFGNDYQF